MTHIAESRKDPRPTTPSPDDQPARTHQVPSTHIPTDIQKILGLTAASENTPAS